MYGTVFLWISFVSACISGTSYYFSKNNHHLLKYARESYLLSFIGIFISSILLVIFIFQHRFEYKYIYAYTSLNLSSELLLSAFWAGQEGSILLWALFAVVLGLILRKIANNKNIERETMLIYLSTITILILLSAIKSPFKLLDVSDANFPMNGRGLNPLLQNFWMVIHPPMLIFGFALLAIPFTLSVTHLWINKINDWLVLSRSWIIISAVILGCGLISGGYWAYGVLGWGGWWGWDPVENSSLVPWIINIMLIHTAVIQMRCGKLFRTNIVLAVLAYFLSVFSSFLTRSGVLADSSVHSFAEIDTIANVVLIIWLCVIVLLAAYFFYKKQNNFLSTIYNNLFLSKENILTLAIIVMGISASTILIGTIKPIFSNGAIDISYYVNTNSVLAMFMLILLGFSLISKWQAENYRLFLRHLIYAILLSVLLLALLYYYGYNHLRSYPLMFASLFGFIISVYIFYKKRFKNFGGALSHIGFTLLILGVILSEHYENKISYALPLNKKINIFGLDFKYSGAIKQDNSNSHYNVEVTEGETIYNLVPKINYNTEDNNVMRIPDYKSSLIKDVYMEPLSLEYNYKKTTMELVKHKFANYDSLKIMLHKFVLQNHMMEKLEGGGSTQIGAIIFVISKVDTQIISPNTIFNYNGNNIPETVYLQNGKIGFELIGIDIGEESKAFINIVDKNKNDINKSESLVVQISIKPFMSLVWISVAFILIGLFISANKKSC